MSLLLCCLFPLFCGAQETIALSTKGPQAPALSAQLCAPDAEIRENMLLNEALLDLVEVRTFDSVMHKRKLRHRLFGVRMPPAFGLRWEYLDPIKRKLVGTCRNDLHQFINDVTDEYDVNFDLVPHLPHYIDMLYEALAFQFGSGRPSPITHKKDQGTAQERLFAARRFHCECTPPEAYHRQLDSLVYPVLNGKNLAEHPNFGESTPSIGLYGPMIADCNHTCHPEIHPYEWLWWRELNTPKAPGKQVWYAMLLRDDSQRMKAWQRGPRLGEIVLPLVFSLEKKNWSLTLSHLIHVPLAQPGNAPLQPLLGDKPALPLPAAPVQIPVTLDGTGGHVLTLRQEGSVADGQCLYRLGEWAVDAQRQLVYVRLHLFVATEKLYALRLTAE